MNLSQEIARRRTFAIISHPDAGKTTLTEKLLLYGGAVQLAGTVTARKHRRSTTSDWMELEKKRGISVSSTVMQFEYNGYAINLLDTPGHKDFSEDTYRVLTAVDAVIMVIDAGKGIENQTRKLFEICRKREIPIFTFMNKLDRPALEPLVLLDELEKVLGLSAFPVNWPLGAGLGFKGIFDRITRQVHLFERTPGGAYRAPVSITSISDPLVRDRLDDQVYNQTIEELELLDMAGSTFDQALVSKGLLTPVYFGSASNNFGVQFLLDSFLSHSAPPQAHRVGDRIIKPEEPKFSGFIFKIQANMDPKHRDRIAFIRICSGVFQRDMPAIHARLGKQLRLSSSHKLFGKERETVDVAYPGDVLGLVGNLDFRIGDTITEDPSIQYDEIPRFAPECFAYLTCSHSIQTKRFRQGLDQLLMEGVVQAIDLPGNSSSVPLLAAVGPLQFELVQFRLESEYGAQARIEPAPFEIIRWVVSPMDKKPSLPSGSQLGTDSYGLPVLLLPGEWALRFFVSQNPDVQLAPLPPSQPSA
jgi:peptide chain release factor 3